MKIYVASSFEQKNDTIEAHRKLREAGHEITLDWTTHKEIEAIQNDKKLAIDYAVQDVGGVLNADTYVLLLGDRKSAGAHIEFGIALGAKLKNIYLVGEVKDPTLFYEHPSVKHVTSIEDLIKELG